MEAIERSQPESPFDFGDDDLDAEATPPSDVEPVKKQKAKSTRDKVKYTTLGSFVGCKSDANDKDVCGSYLVGFSTP